MIGWSLQSWEGNKIDIGIKKCSDMKYVFLIPCLLINGAVFCQDYSFNNKYELYITLDNSGNINDSLSKEIFFNNEIKKCNKLFIKNVYDTLPIVIKELDWV